MLRLRSGGQMVQRSAGEGGAGPVPSPAREQPLRERRAQYRDDRSRVGSYRPGMTLVSTRRHLRSAQGQGRAALLARTFTVEVEAHCVDALTQVDGSPRASYLDDHWTESDALGWE